MLGAHGDNRFKVIAYKYDLVSGKVNQVHYQPGQRDQLYHRYVYDAENRLTDVYVTDSKATINDRDLEEHDAHYEYYKHGPLARTVLGNQQVQGLDYAYTLQGWLKGVNSTGLTTTLDMGNDSKADDRHPLVARDVFGFNLNYFTGDYAAISGKNVFPGHTGIISPSTAYRALYNGNISSMAVNIGKFNQPQLYNYQYDQLNRLVAMDVFRGYVTGSNSWSAITQVNDYKERISYDGNGNILSYLRNGTTADSGPITMDSMSYKYFTNTDGTYRNNRLRLVRDSVATGNFSVDIDDQLPRVSNAADSNYVYDAIGNLIQDKSENITNIQWTVYGKIQKITKTAVNTGDVSAISYWYDAAGNRVGKKVEALNRKPQYSWYTRDASGNVMGVYQYEGNTLTDDTLRLREHHLYGSSRIGVWNRWINMDVPVSTGTTINLLGKSYDGTFERGNKFFELSNHLGNVLATVSDKKFGHNGGSGVVDYYDADVVTASDYYPFGMLMPDRQFGQGENFPGVLVNGTTTVNGYSLPIDLNLTSRGTGDAAEYVASNSVEFDGEFESSSTDEFSAYIADNTYAGTGNQVSGGGAYGTAGRYRYGFNGKENDNEVKGVGNQQDYGMRIYDPRVGKFLSVDPLQADYPMLTPYQYAGNNPVAGIDLDGKEFEWFMLEQVEKKFLGTSHLKNVRAGFVERGMKTVTDGVNLIKNLTKSKASAPVYGNGFTTLTAGIPAGYKSLTQKEIESQVNTAKEIVRDYGDLLYHASKGDDKAIGGLVFEAAMLFFPTGEGIKSISLVPRGFKNAEQFAKVGEELIVALEKSGIMYEQVGITGSAVTNVSSKGGAFRQEAINGLKASDIDAFILLREDIPIKGGVKRPEFVHPDKMLKEYPALKEWSDKWSQILGREITPAAIKPNAANKTN